MKHRLFIYTIQLLVIACLTACNDQRSEDGSLQPKSIAFDIQHPGSVTRATDSDFENGDRIGVFMTDKGQPLMTAGNYLTNVALTFSGISWNPAYPLYWNEGEYDVYGYYPFATAITTVSDMPFSVQTEQDSHAGYTASDFLWAQRKGVSAGDGSVNLTFSHLMSRLMIKLVKGNDYEGELPEDAEVYVHSTITDGTIDLNAGVATRNTHGSRQTIHAQKNGNYRYTAIIFPQRLDNRQPLVEVVSHGVSYLYESKFLFKPGIQHNVLLSLSDNPEKIKITIGGEKENWNE